MNGAGLKIRRGSPLVGVRPPLPAPPNQLTQKSLAASLKFLGRGVFGLGRVKYAQSMSILGTSGCLLCAISVIVPTKNSFLLS